MQIRVLTYNVHKCIGGLDRKYDPVRVVETIAHYRPDVVMLQEVDRGVRRSNGHHQVDLLGDMLEFQHRTWFPNVRVRGGGEYGNAILSRYPLTETSNIDLTVPPKKRRSVLHARYRIRLRKKHGRETSRTLHVYNMHLGLAGGERKVQLRKFMDSHPFARLHENTPVIVGGDFNDLWGTLGKKLMKPGGFRGTPVVRTFPAYAPVRPLDAIYVRGHVEITHVQRGRTALAKQASDHLPLIADLQIK